MSVCKAISYHHTPKYGSYETEFCMAFSFSRRWHYITCQQLLILGLCCWEASQQLLEPFLLISRRQWASLLCTVISYGGSLGPHNSTGALDYLD